MVASVIVPRRSASPASARSGLATANVEDPVERLIVGCEGDVALVVTLAGIDPAPTHRRVAPVRLAQAAANCRNL